MKKFKFDFCIEAGSQAEANSKMKSLAVLASKLNQNELEKLAHIVKNDPVKTQMAKAALGV